MSSTKSIQLVRGQRVRDVWAWLPAFRAVAETEHLPTAAKRLHLTPAALSRSVRLLEDTLGRPLFHRVGRGIKLSTAGRQLAGAVRGAMRLVDDGIEEVLDERLRGPLLICAPPALHPVVLEAARGLEAVHPEITLTLNTRAAPEADLWAGRVDVALSYTAPRDPELMWHLVVELETKLCSRVLAPTSVVIYPSDSGLPSAPLDLPAGLICESLVTARQACEFGSSAAVLPEVFAGDLRQHPARCEPVRVYVMMRPTLLAGGRPEAFAEILETALTSL